jgi:hypothetical protein
MNQVTPKKKRFGDARDNEGHTFRCSMPPRMRNGKSHAGGRSLRRSMKNLAAFKAAYVSDVKGMKQTIPGSMKR